MKMKTGPKIVLLALIFVALGFWMGRGFPRTWQELVRPDAPKTVIPVGQPAPAPTAVEPGAAVDEETAARIAELESRLATLESEIAVVRSRLQVPAPGSGGAGGAAPVAPGAAPTPSAQTPFPQAPGPNTPGAPEFTGGL